jgi:hypothetical protein
MYNKAAFAQTAARLGWKSARLHNRSGVISTAQIEFSINTHGYAIIPLRDEDSVRARAKRKHFRWSFTKINETEMKVKPKAE